MNDLKPVKQIHIYMTLEKHTRIKVAIAKEQTTITDVIDQLLDKWLEEKS